MAPTKFPRIALALLALAGVVLTGCSGQPDQYIGKPGAVSTGPGQDAAADVAQFADIGMAADALLAMPVGATCSLESVVSMANGQPSPGETPNSYLARRGSAYRMIGFATNSQSGTVPASVRIVLLGGTAWGIEARTGLERPDVADYFRVPAFSSAGYQADAGFDDVPPGEYRVFVIGTDGSTEVACPSHHRVLVQ